MQADHLTEIQAIRRLHDKIFPGLGNFSADELGLTAEEFPAYVRSRDAGTR